MRAVAATRDAHRRSRRYLVPAAVAAAVTLTLGACGSSGHPGSGGGSSVGVSAQPPNGPARTTGKITIGTTFAPGNLSPGLDSSGADYQYLELVFEPLITLNLKTGALEPDLATSWRYVGPKKLHFDVELRHGVKFSDGTPFNAAAVVSFDKDYITEGNILSDLQYVTKVTALNPYEVQYTLRHPNSQLAYGLADRAGLIPSPTAFKKEGKSFGTQPVGAGPYKFVSENAGATYTFTRNNMYWNNAHLPRAQNITFQIFGNDTTLISALRSGTVDVANGLFPQDVQTLRAAGLNVEVTPGTGFIGGYFNGRLAPFSKAKMRLAFNLALNRTAIANAGTDGIGKPWDEVIAPGTHGYSKSEEPVYPYDPARAKRLVAQAGYPHGIHVTCYAYPGLGFQITGPIVLAEEKKVGIDINLITGAAAQVDPFYTKNLSPCYFSGFGGGANPVTTYEALMFSQSYYNAGKTNFGVDQYLNELYDTYSVSKEQAIFNNINKVQKTDPSNFIIYGSPEISAYRKDIGGWIVTPYGAGAPPESHWQGLYFVK